MGVDLLVRAVVGGVGGGAVAAVPKAGLRRGVVVVLLVVVDFGPSGDGGVRGWEGEEGEEAPVCLGERKEGLGGQPRGGKLWAQPIVGGPGELLRVGLTAMGAGARRLAATA